MDGYTHGTTAALLYPLRNTFRGDKKQIYVMKYKAMCLLAIGHIKIAFELFNKLLKKLLKNSSCFYTNHQRKSITHDSINTNTISMHIHHTSLFHRSMMNSDINVTVYMLSYLDMCAKCLVIYIFLTDLMNKINSIL